MDTSPKVPRRRDLEMNLRRILVSVVAVVALVGMAVPAPADTSRIKASGSAPGSYRWGSGFKHIQKGDKIVWKNPTGATHTVTAYAGSWSKDSSVPSGGQTAFKFTKKGSFKYRCMQPGHSSLSGGECDGMCGEIHVTR
jgi:plastocyanin